MPQTAPGVRPSSAALVLFLLMLGFCSSAHAGLNDAPKKVREGIEHYDAGRFAEAAAAFDRARQKRPDDARVTFDAACAKAAAGAVEEAVALFQQAALTRDSDLAARCHYNLGLLAARRAKAALGDQPETADTDARKKAQELAAAAIDHWRDCLAVSPQHTDARYNIELAKQWRDHMDRAWKAADRKKRLEKMKLREMLQWLESEQGNLRHATRELEGREPSPISRLAVHAAAVAQRELSDDVEPLKQKIAQEMNGPPAGQGGPAGAMAPAPTGSPFASMDPQQREHAIKLLSGLADEAGQSMRTAAERLAEQSPADARKDQATAIEHIDQLHTVITPYPDLVHRAVERQKQLVGKPPNPNAATNPSRDRKGADGAPHQNPSRDRKAADGGPRSVVAADDSTTPSATAEPGPPHPSAAPEDNPDPAEAAWRQRFVERWTPILVAKAKQGLAAMPPAAPEQPAAGTADKDSQAAAGNVLPDTGGLLPDAGVPPPAPKKEEQPKPDTPSASPTGLPSPEDAARQQQENLRKSMELAVKLGPDVQRLVARAAADLDDHRPSDALPGQKEALRLLEKIAEPLKQPNQNQQNQDQQNQNQHDKKDNKDQDKQDQQKDKKDQQKDQQDKKDQDKKQDPKKRDQPQQPQKQPAQPKDQQQKAGQTQPKDLNRQQAEALLQQVRQRDREKEKARKAMMEIISRPPSVEKDW